MFITKEQIENPILIKVSQEEFEKYESKLSADKRIVNEKLLKLGINNLFFRGYWLVEKTLDSYAVIYFRDMMVLEKFLKGEISY